MVKAVEMMIRIETSLFAYKENYKDDLKGLKEFSPSRHTNEIHLTQ